MTPDIAFLFCCDYFDKTCPDSDYAEEYFHVKNSGIQVFLFSLESFLERNKLNIIAAERPTTLIYRGWMLAFEQYAELYRLSRDKGFSLINTPEQYRQCHHLPFWYSLLAEYTAKSVWKQGVPDESELVRMLKPFGGSPVIVKDYVKSRKHEWKDACFIPDASDVGYAIGVINNFVSRQGEDLAGGVVLREYLRLNMLGRHEKSDMPIAEEVRVFCINHKPFAHIQYWSGGEYHGVSEYQALLRRCDVLDSNFCTIDIARRENGEWVIIEVGDGQVSGLQNFSAASFYEALLLSIA